MDDMKRREELGKFLRARRDELSPEQVGVRGGSRRRVRGLRREEVAQLANVGVTWYTWLEQGRNIEVSVDVLTNIARALQLRPDQRAYLFRVAERPLPSDSPLKEEVTPLLQRALDAYGPTPACIFGRRYDILAWNQATCAVFLDPATIPVNDRNLLWILLTVEPERHHIVNWELHAQTVLRLFRANWSHYLGDQAFSDLIERLTVVSPKFREWWASYDVTETAQPCKEVNHPSVGHLIFDQIGYNVHGNPGLLQVVYLPRDEATLTKLKRLHDVQAYASAREQPTRLDPQPASSSVSV